MVKIKKNARFLKNRNWKSKVANHLRGRPEEICQEYLRGVIDRFQPLHVLREARWRIKSQE